MENLFDNLSEENKDILRQRWSNLDVGDTSTDDDLRELNTEQISGCIIGWTLGSDEWLDFVLETIAEVKEFDPKDFKEAVYNIEL